MREFRIDWVDVEKTLAKAQKLATRGQKKGLTGGFSCRIENRTETIEGINYQYQVLVIEGEPVKYQDWQFVGVAEFVEGKAITKTIAGAEVLPSTIKAGWCDHCQTNRKRSTIIIVKHDSGKLSQVGSSCVKDYLGWVFSPTALVTEEDFEEEFGNKDGGFHSGIGTSTILTYAVCAVEKIGYVKSDNGISTKELVWGRLSGGEHGKNLWKSVIGETPTDEQVAKAYELIEYGKNFEGDSAYAENVRVVSSLEYQTWSTVGILISIIKAKQKAVEAEIAKAGKPIIKNEQFAPTGERVEIPVKVISENTFETAFGWTTLYTFLSGEYQFKWFSSSNHSIQVGDEINIKGTIKGSDEYKGVFSTVLTRCKVA